MGNRRVVYIDCGTEKCQYEIGAERHRQPYLNPLYRNFVLGHDYLNFQISLVQNGEKYK